MLVSDWFRKFHNHPIIQTHPITSSFWYTNKRQAQKEIICSFKFLFSIMIRFTCSLVLFALIAIVYSTDYFVEKFEGKYCVFILIEFIHLIFYR